MRDVPDRVFSRFTYLVLLWWRSWHKISSQRYGTVRADSSSVFFFRSLVFTPWGGDWIKGIWRDPHGGNCVHGRLRRSPVTRHALRPRELPYLLLCATASPPHRPRTRTSNEPHACAAAIGVVCRPGADVCKQVPYDTARQLAAIQAMERPIRYQPSPGTRT